MKHFHSWKWLSILLLIIVPVTMAQSNQDCPAIVQQALDTTGQMCEAAGRNQVCYGYVNVQANPQPGISTFEFEKPGDTTSVDSVRSLQLSPLQLDEGLWGVALMRLQANLPTDENSNITLLTFGNVQIQNAVLPPTRLEVLTNTVANLRQLPNTTSAILGSLSGGQTVTALERLEDNSWLRVQLPDSDQTGWVSANLFAPTDHLTTLNIAAPAQPHYQPMQAFYFEAGAEQPACASMPRSGMLIQTPEGSAEIRLWINEVQIHMGSTVLFEAQPGGAMTVTTVEGHARVEALGVSHTAYAGTSVSVSLNAEMKPASPPSLPVTYDASTLQNLPLNLLQRPIEIHPGLTAQEIQTALQTEVTASQAVSDAASDAQTVATDLSSQVVSVVSPPGVEPTSAPVVDNTNPGDSGDNDNSNNDDGGGDDDNGGLLDWLFGLLTGKK